MRITKHALSKRLPAVFALFLFLFIGFSIGVAQETAVELFLYEEGPLGEVGAAENGWASAWGSVTAGSVEIVAPTGYDHPVVEESGNAIELLEGGTIFRDLADVWPDDGRDYWVSFLHQRIDNNDVAESYGGLSLFKGGSELLYIGKPWALMNVGLEGSGLNDKDTTSTNAYELVWIVVKLMMSGDGENDLAALWLNPEMGVEPDTANADAMVHWRGSNGFDRIRLGSGNPPNSEFVMFDEIRISLSSPTVPSKVAEQVLPERFYLQQNYPNPFNPSTSIQFGLKTNDFINIEVFNMAGVKVNTLAEGLYSAGAHEVVWNGKNAQGKSVAGGVYLCRLKTTSFTKTIRMLMVQ